MIIARDLRYRFGAAWAVDGVSLSVAPGEIVGLLGPNGAGKTTLLRMLAGVLAPASGTVEIAGASGVGARRRLGYLPEGAPAAGDMRVTEFLEYRARLKGVRDPASVVRELCEQTGLGEVGRKVIATLSRGYRQRVGLAEALVARPDVLLLDEPMTGLDPVQSSETRELVRTLGNAAAVVLSSHALGEMQALATRVVIMASGQIRADGAPRELAARLGPGATLSDVFSHAVGAAA